LRHHSTKLCTGRAKRTTFQIRWNAVQHQRVPIQDQVRPLSQRQYFTCSASVRAGEWSKPVGARDLTIPGLNRPAALWPDTFCSDFLCQSKALKDYEKKTQRQLDFIFQFGCADCVAHSSIRPNHRLHLSRQVE